MGVRSISLARRRRIVREIPPRRCSAHSARTGKPCREWALVGADVCVTHGARARQVRAAAAVRVHLAEWLAGEDPRPFPLVFAETVHTADGIHRYEKSRVIALDKPTVNDVQRLAEVAATAGRLAKLGMDADIDQQQARINAQTVDVLQKIILAVVVRLGHDPSDRSVRAAVFEEIQAAKPRAIEGSVV